MPGAAEPATFFLADDLDEDGAKHPAFPGLPDDAPENHTGEQPSHVGYGFLLMPLKNFQLDLKQPY